MANETKDLDAFDIIQTLFPYLIVAAHYSRHIQQAIVPLKEKNLPDNNNIFSQALSAADLSIQNLVEVALLAHFPHLAFFGEEHEKSYNTPYIKSTTWNNNPRPNCKSDSFLVLLDPIDGTRRFLDKHDNFQIILSVITPSGFEGALLIFPARQNYYYAIKDKGTYFGASLNEPITKATRFIKSDCSINPESKPCVYISNKAEIRKPDLLTDYYVHNGLDDYTNHKQPPGSSDILRGSIAATILGRSSYIDHGAIIFIAKEAGYIVANLDGSLQTVPNINTDTLQITPTIVATNQKVLNDIIKASPYQVN
jgi:fructose-1,6-bisphosphatase/inositol monophosphatase family enzyme